MCKVKTMVFASFLVAGVLSACTLTGEQIDLEGSGNIESQEKDLSGFDELRISHAFQVDVKQGEDYHVITRVDDNVQEYLVVDKSGDTLRIGLDPDYNYSTKNTTLEAEVTMPELVRIRLSGSSDATISGFASTSPFSADLSGSSSLRGEIESGDARVDVSGSSSVILTGAAQDLTIDASGSSDVDLSALRVSDANVDASGSSTVTVKPYGRLTVGASGASNVYYLGEPTLGNIDTSGSSSVEHR
jgi:hypothetical protein